MIMPPAVTRIRVEGSRGKDLRLWVPVILLWPLLFVVGLLAMAVAALADAVLLLGGRSYHHYTRLIAGCLDVLAETRGMMVKVYGSSTNVHIEVR